MEDAVLEAESLLHKQEEQIKQKETEADQGRKGGLLDHIIHNLVSPLSPGSGDVSEKKDEVLESNHGARTGNEGSAGSEEEVGNGNNDGGGLIKNVISNFFHQNEQAEVAEINEKKNEEEIVKSVEENTGVKKEDGGIIDNIVSYLTTSLPDDVAPTTDEASILIHSIIHD